jgi:hypothetical protein
VGCDDLRHVRSSPPVTGAPVAGFEYLACLRRPRAGPASDQYAEQGALDIGVHSPERGVAQDGDNEGSVQEAVPVRFRVQCGQDPGRVVSPARVQVRAEERIASRSVLGLEPLGGELRPPAGLVMEPGSEGRTRPLKEEVTHHSSESKDESSGLGW